MSPRNTFFSYFQDNVVTSILSRVNFKILTVILYLSSNFFLMNWTFVIPFSFTALYVLVFIILRKQNDEGDAEEKLNVDYTGLIQKGIIKGMKLLDKRQISAKLCFKYNIP